MKKNRRWESLYAAAFLRGMESMRKAKRFWLLALAVALLLTCAACGNKAADRDPAGNTTQQEGDPDTGKDKYETDPVPEGKPAPVEPEDTTIDKSTTYTCTISITCETILDNWDAWDEWDKEAADAKKPLVPSDGVILGTTSVTFSEGESVFDVLQRVCRQNGIHMESSWTPMYNSAYVEGINNLYEFDVSQGSGWMYSVNGWFPNYGCSRYVLQDGDSIAWRYTCDYGDDVGGGYAAG